MSQIVPGPQSIGTLSNPVRVDPTGTTPQPVTQSGPWTVTANVANNQSVNVNQFGGSNVALGQQVAANSVPVILPSATVTALTPPTTIQVAPIANNASGWTPFSFTAMNNAVTLIKTGAGKLGGYDFLNPSNNNAFIQVFDVVAANNVTLGSTTPAYVISRGSNMAWNHEWVNGIQHNNGIVVAATNTATGNLSPASSLIGFIGYK